MSSRRPRSDDDDHDERAQRPHIAETPPSVLELLKNPSLNLTAEEQDRYAKALIVNKYLTAGDLEKANYTNIKDCGIPVADAQKIYDSLHPSSALLEYFGEAKQ